MTIPVFVAVAGFVLWLLFSRIGKIADGWLAEVGKIMFTLGLLVYLFSVSGSRAF